MGLARFIPGWCNWQHARLWIELIEVRILAPEQGHLYNAAVTDWGTGCVRCGVQQGLRKVRLRLFHSHVKCVLVCLPCQQHINEIITNLRDDHPSG